MEPIKINVQVNVGLTDNVVTLLSALLNKGTAPATEAAPKPEKPAAKPQAVEQPKPAAEEKAEQPKPEAAPEPQPEEAPEKEYTAVDVRAAMDRTRKRIEGANYKETPDSEGYKTWHRVLTAWFKKTAAVYGAEKPSTLPTSDKRAAFIKECDAIFVKDGELTQDLPF